MGSREILERVRAERNRPQADFGGAPRTPLFKLPPTKIFSRLTGPPGPTKFLNRVATRQDRWFGTYQTPEVIVYNSDAVKPEEAPKDWDDVLDPKWRDKILIRNPNPSDSMRAIFGAMIWRFYKDTGSPEAGYDWLRRLDANVHEYTADGTLLMQKLVRREGSDQFWNLPDVWIYKEQKGFPVGYVFPASGTPVITDGIAIVRGGPNEEEAKRFYEFVTTPESLTLAAKKYYRIPLRTDLDRSQLPAWMNEPLTRCRLTGICCASRAATGCATGTPRFADAARNESADTRLRVRRASVSKYLSLTVTRSRICDLHNRDNSDMPLLSLKNLSKTLRQDARRRRRVSRCRARRVLWLAWSLRLRQNNHAANDRRSGKT